MANWRDTKAAARRVVQDTMQIPFVYLASGLPYVEDSNSAGELPILQARLHLSDKALGDQAGTSLNSAERVEPIRAMIFWQADLDEHELGPITLERNAILVAQDGDAYCIDHIEPLDVETITVRVSPVDEADAQGLPRPEVE